MEKIFNWLGKLPADKYLHFIAGMLIVAVIATFFPMAADQAWIVAVIIGFGKEIYDRYNDGVFDILDLFATWAGGLIIQILIWC